MKLQTFAHFITSYEKEIIKGQLLGGKYILQFVCVLDLNPDPTANFQIY